MYRQIPLVRKIRKKKGNPKKKKKASSAGDDAFTAFQLLPDQMNKRGGGMIE